MSYYGDRDRGDRDRGSRGGDRDRPNPCRLYVGKVSRYVREQDLKDLFSRFGRIRDFVLRDFYAFIEFDNVRDAEDASKELNGYRLEDERLIVQVANRARDRTDRDRDSRRDRDRDGRDRDYNRSDRGRRDAPSDSGSDRCYNCGEFGHIANECSLPKGSGERAMRFQKGCCFECGQSGHRARDCPDRDNGGSSRRRRSRTRSRSPVRRSRSPPRRSRNERRSRSPRRSPSPRRDRRRSRSRSNDSRRRSDSPNGRSISPKRRSSDSPSKRRSNSVDSSGDVKMESGY